VVELETLGRIGTRPVVSRLTATWGAVYYLSPRGKVRRQDVFWAEDGWSQASKPLV